MIEQAQKFLRQNPAKWCVSGVAGFIGSHLLERLLGLGQEVVGIDNFATGSRSNLDSVREAVGAQAWSRFRLVEADVCETTQAQAVCQQVDYVLHQAALGSVPRSIRDPLGSNRANIVGFLSMLDAARNAGVKRFVYAASSSTYGDSTALPKVEDKIGAPLSPYALTKLVNELYAEVYARVYDMRAIGLRYFNVFGPRQNPEGAYAAVIPRWINGFLQGSEIKIYGDGKTSRDFCYVENAVNANILAAMAPSTVGNEVFNVAVGEQTTLNDLFALIQQAFIDIDLIEITNRNPVYADFRAGDVRHSLADVAKAQKLLNHHPLVRVADGIQRTVRWFASQQER